MVLSGDDLKAIRHLVKTEIQIETPKVIEKVIAAKMGGLLSKGEFYTKMDELMNRIKSLRREIITVHSC